MHFGHSASKLDREVTATQMNVKCGCLDTPVTRKGRDLMDVPVGSRQIGQTQMPQRMRSKPWQVASLGYTCNYLGPRPDRNRFPLISIRLG